MEDKMPEDFVIYESGSVRTFVREVRGWVHFFRDKKDINGRVSQTLFAELHKDKAPEFIKWLQDFLQE